jgi:hypothetical protein
MSYKLISSVADDTAVTINSHQRFDFGWVIGKGNRLPFYNCTIPYFACDSVPTSQDALTKGQPRSRTKSSIYRV